MNATTHHGDTETPRKLIREELTELVIGAAIEAHRELGPGLLESAYQECLCHELRLRNIPFGRQLLSDSKRATADLLKTDWKAGWLDPQFSSTCIKRRNRPQGPMNQEFNSPCLSVSVVGLL